MRCVYFPYPPLHPGVSSRRSEVSLCPTAPPVRHIRNRAGNTQVKCIHFTLSNTFCLSLNCPLSCMFRFYPSFGRRKYESCDQRNRYKPILCVHRYRLLHSFTKVSGSNCKTPILAFLTIFECLPPHDPILVFSSAPSWWRPFLPACAACASTGPGRSLRAPAQGSG